MRKNSWLIIPILLIILSGCSDISVGGDSSYQKDAVEITTLAKGEIMHIGSILEIDYTVNEPDVILNKLIVSIIDSDNAVVKEVIIEEEPLNEWVSGIELEEGLPNGRYTLRLEFYEDEEIFLTDEREFFISDASYFIKSITSYPPVLYPGGGGLLSADIESPMDDCWLRWSLDGREIASGMRSEGYQSIRIDAPEKEGVYELNLEVFPLPPEDAYDYQSTVKNSIPVYVNTNQKVAANEFGPDDDFYALFHFRGNLINSSDNEVTDLEKLEQIGNPTLAVRNGVLGYYLDSRSGFQSATQILPVEDGRLKSFSLMFSVIPEEITGLYPEDEAGNLFYSGSSDGSLSLALDILSDGQLSAAFTVGGGEYLLSSGVPLVAPDIYASIGLSVFPEDRQLTLIWYKDGVPVSEKVYPAEAEMPTAPWQAVDVSDMELKTRFAGTGGFEGLIDELGIYYLHSSEGPAIDPEQYRRSMELEYGKFLMYAEGFDSTPEDLNLQSETVSIAGSKLIIKPGGYADFPPVYPGYEEIVFNITLADSSTTAFEVVFNPDGQDDEIVRVDLAAEADDTQPVKFSLIFSPDSVSVGETEAQDGETGFTGDFGGIVYRLINDDDVLNLEIESVLVIRKSINVSNAGVKENRFAGDSEPDITAGVNISR